MKSRNKNRRISTQIKYDIIRNLAKYSPKIKKRYKSFLVNKQLEDSLGMSLGQWKRIKRDIIKRDRSICRKCKTRLHSNAKQHSDYERTIDHVIPLSEGGLTVAGNLVLICQKCHRKKNHISDMI